MRNTKKKTLDCSVFSARYWSEAAREFRDLRVLVFAALIVALRIGVKFFKIPLTDSLFLSFDCYVNSVGSLVCGPLVGLAIGAISDNLGFLVSPSGVYFPLFTLVEMSSSFIFALFFWRRRITVPRALAAKFTVNLICNIILNSSIIKLQYYLLGDEKFYTYNVINTVRIAKNLALFPLEAVLICLILSAVVPVLRRAGLCPADQEALRFRKKDVILVAVFFVLSVAIVLFYVFFLKDWVSAHNLKLL